MHSFRRSVALLCISVALLQASAPAWADGLSGGESGSGAMGGSLSGSTGGYSLSQDLGSAGSGSEFVSGNFPGAILMPVNLWGAVPKTGIHHIPTHTDLITLLSLAGGPTPDAELDHVIIKRRSSGEEKIIKIDAEELLTKAGKHSPELEANDIILVPREKPPVSSSAMTTMAFVSSILGVLLSGVAVAAVLKK